MKTLITRLKNLDQYNSSEKTILWEDPAISRWKGVYNEIGLEDSGIFITGDKLLIGKVSEISEGKSFLLNNVKEVTCTNDEFLQIDAVYPELISRVKASFQPFIHPLELDLNKILKEINNKSFVGYYLISGSTKYDRIKSSLARHDRVIIVAEDGSLENIKKHVSNGLEEFAKSLELSTNVVGLTIDEMLSLNQKVSGNSKRSNNVNRLIDINFKLKQDGVYKFSSFFAYHDTLYNKKVYLNNSTNQVNVSSNENDIIDLNGVGLYKISHGSFKANKNKHVIEALKHNNWITIHENTGKGRPSKFKNKLKKGDYVYITLGGNELIGIARITSNVCQYIPKKIINNQDGWLFREIEMIKEPVKKGSIQLDDTRAIYPSGNTSFFKVKSKDLKEVNQLLFKPYFNVEFRTGISSKLNEEDKKISLNNYLAPLNRIFYGPPGTGKTYNTILEAAKIINQDESIRYNEALDVFNNELCKRIEFITFHQNYSYEDFIQGLRPDTEISGQLSFEKKDGVFKRIADKALKNLMDSKNPAAAKKEFSTVLNELIQPLSDGDKEEVEIKMKKTSFYITEVGEKSIEFRKNQGDSKHTLSIATLKRMYDKGSNEIILGGLQPYYNPLLNVLLGKGKTNVEPVKKQNYVIIIDEINRANISRVFGELITLIEKDKRSGGKIPLTATLPSGDEFIVPSNLYIIGTMNTADKSIALLDIALRRRFQFIPMYPKYEVLENGSNAVSDFEILEKINNEIISRKGHDFTIGHSYFMGDDYELRDTIDNKVLPLLLEYFMNDYDEVKKILSAANLEVEGWPMQLVKND
jgi:hypothetical protein